MPYQFDVSPQQYFNRDPSTLPAGLRNNNPFNIKYVGQRNSLGPSSNTDQGDPQAVYASPQAGAVAGAQLILRKYGQGRNTTESLIAANGGWTPGAHNSAQNVAKTMGVTPTTPLNLSDPGQLQSFMRALALQEHGPTAKLIGDDVFANAASTALGGQGSVAMASRSPMAGGQPAAQPQAMPMRPLGAVGGPAATEPYIPGSTAQAMAAPPPAMTAPAQAPRSLFAEAPQAPQAAPMAPAGRPMPSTLDQALAPAQSSFVPTGGMPTGNAPVTNAPPPAVQSADSLPARPMGAVQNIGGQGFLPVEMMQGTPQPIQQIQASGQAIQQLDPQNLGTNGWTYLAAR